MEWMETPTEPGMYLLHAIDRYVMEFVIQDPIHEQGVLSSKLMKVSDIDGWWLGPIPEPIPWVTMPRISLPLIAKPHTRQSIPQAECRNLMGLDERGLPAIRDSKSVHRHTERCIYVGCRTVAEAQGVTAVSSTGSSRVPVYRESETSECLSAGRNTQTLSQEFPLSVATNDQDHPAAAGD